MSAYRTLCHACLQVTSGDCGMHGPFLSYAGQPAEPGPLPNFDTVDTLRSDLARERAARVAAEAEIHDQRVGLDHLADERDCERKRADAAEDERDALRAAAPSTAHRCYANTVGRDIAEQHAHGPDTPCPQRLELDALHAEVARRVGAAATAEHLQSLPTTVPNTPPTITPPPQWTAATREGLAACVDRAAARVGGSAQATLVALRDELRSLLPAPTPAVALLTGTCSGCGRDVIDGERHGEDGVRHRGPCPPAAVDPATVPCPSCYGYGHFDGHGDASLDRRDRTCTRCGGEGTMPAPAVDGEEPGR